MNMEGTACEDDAARRLARFGAVCTLLGTLLSGPIAMAVVAATHPQPPWQSAALFAERYHPVQALPFFLGFVLVGGFVVLIASLHRLADGAQRGRTTCALVFAAAFASLVFFNYIVQTTFVPELVRHYTQGDASLIAALSMAHPGSLGWGLEMWGYGLLGVATWLVAPVFSGVGVQRFARWAFVANGPVSIVPAAWTACDPAWVMTSPGLASFAFWNALVVAMAVLTLIAFRSPTSGKIQ